MMTPQEISERVAAIATEGRYWWRGTDGQCYSTHDYADGPGYLLYASPGWVEQWAGDWDAAAAALADIAAMNGQS